MVTYCFDYIRPRMMAETKNKTAQNCLLDKTIGYKVYHNCNYFVSLGVSNGKVYDSIDKPILETETFSPNENNYSFEQRRSKEECPLFYAKSVVWLGNLPYAFGHSFTDGLKSLWFYFTKDFQELLSSGACPIISIPSESNVLPDYYKFFFQALGIDLNSIFFINRNYSFQEIIVPDLCWSYIKGEIKYSKEYAIIINKIINYSERNNNSNITFPSRIYLTRTNFSVWTREVGERSIEKLFQKVGYSIISPEKESIEAQIQLIRHCDNIVATEGTISHLAVFCRPNTNVVILRKTDWVNPYQVALNQVASVNVTYIDVHKTKVCKNEWKRMSGPFYLYVSQELKKYLKTNSFTIPVVFCPSYWWYRLRLLPWFANNVLNRKFVHRLLRY